MFECELMVCPMSNIQPDTQCRLMHVCLDKLHEFSNLLTRGVAIF